MGAMMPAFFYAALTLGRGVGGSVLQRLPEQRVLQAGYGIAVIGIGFLLRTSTLTGVMASAVITGLSFATVYRDHSRAADFPKRFGWRRVVWVRLYGRETQSGDHSAGHHSVSVEVRSRNQCQLPRCHILPGRNALFRQPLQH